SRPGRAAPHPRLRSRAGRVGSPARGRATASVRARTRRPGARRFGATCRRRRARGRRTLRAARRASREPHRFPRRATRTHDQPPSRRARARCAAAVVPSPQILVERESVRELTRDDRTAAARRSLERAAATDVAAASGVRLEQTGRMWQKPGGRPLDFTASQSIAVDEVAFSWRARFGRTIRVVDRFAGGEGELEVKLLGLVSVGRARGPETSESEAMRYLAELPWAPHAVA